MIINHHKYGQLCNRLLYTAHLINCSIETDHTLIDHSLEEYAPYFESIDEKGTLIFKRNKVPSFMIQLFSNMLFRIHTVYPFIKVLAQNDLIKQFDLNSQKYFKKIRSGNNWLAEQWGVHVSLSLKKNKEVIKKTFTPKAEFIKNVNSFIDEVKLKHDVLVGIHLRRGDYKEYKDGKYYFTDAQYDHIMVKLNTLFPSGSVAYVLVSNEKIIQSNFTLPTFVPPNNHPIEDLYILSKCDYIIGPPSSYSTWASFYGETPLKVIENSDENVTLEHFKVFY